MANSAAQDDGLIILSDDTTTQVIDTPQTEVSLTPSPEPVLDFSLGEGSTNSSSPVTISRPTSDASVSTPGSLDFSFNLDSTQTEQTPVTIETAPVSSPVQEDLGVFGGGKSSSPLPLSDETDMDAILDTTIAQLKSRQEVIAQVKEKKTSRIADLSHQVEELQQQVADLKDDVVDLDDENARINTNIASLESMKMFEKTQEEEKVREHNLKKVSKK